MICFHFTIFVVLETTLAVPGRHLERLWFAFILLSLSYWKQLCVPDYLGEASCDLLSFYYLCRTGNNAERSGAAPEAVVICFHFTIFVVLETTATAFPPTRPALWFAFILLSLSYWKQQVTYKEYAYTSCDLLSFYYLCRTGNNRSAGDHFYTSVVICFHFTIFVVLETTWRLRDGRCGRLWFAFILLSLSYWKQREKKDRVHPTRCDLLSFYYLCRTGNNATAFPPT